MLGVERAVLAGALIGDTIAASGQPASADTGFRRLHPLTPVLRGWTWLGAVGAYSAQQWGADYGATTYLVGLAILLPCAAAYGTASWWFTRYRIDPDLRLGFAPRR